MITLVQVILQKCLQNAEKLISFMKTFRLSRTQNFFQCQSLDMKEVILGFFVIFACHQTPLNKQTKKYRILKANRRLKIGVGGWPYNINRKKQTLIYAWLLQCMRNALPQPSCHSEHQSQKQLCDLVIVSAYGKPSEDLLGHIHGWLDSHELSGAARACCMGSSLSALR